MNEIIVQEIEIDESPIPDGCIQKLNEVQVKKFGQIWRIYKNDLDPFPSNPHAHNIESGLKLDLSNGKLFFKHKDTGKRISMKHLLLIRDQITNINLPALIDK